MSTTPEIEALTGLTALLNTAVEALRQPQMQLHLVIINSSGPPEVKTCENEEAVVNEVNKLRQQQEEDPENNIYVQLIEGKRWSLVKGANPGFKCGERFVPFKSVDNLDGVDDTGCLS